MRFKIVLRAYSRGIGDFPPHFTTLAAFVAAPGDMAAKLFA